MALKVESEDSLVKIVERHLEVLLSLNLGYLNRCESATKPRSRSGTLLFAVARPWALRWLGTIDFSRCFLPQTLEQQLYLIMREEFAKHLRLDGVINQHFAAEHVHHYLVDLCVGFEWELLPKSEPQRVVQILRH